MRGEFYKMEYEAWDQGTEQLTLEQEGAYLRFCHQMYRRKEPVVDDKVVLARLWKCHPNKAASLRAGLIKLGKIVETGEGHLTNTRVTQELDTRETQSTQRSDAGRTGGRRSGEVRRKSLENNKPDEALASSQTNQIRGEERRVEYSEPNGSGADAPGTPPSAADLPSPSDPDYWPTRLFREGVQLVRSMTGKPDSSARTLIGKWRKSARDDCRQVLRLLEDARDQNLADPIPWIERSLNQRARPSARTEDLLFARM